MNRETGEIYKPEKIKEMLSSWPQLLKDFEPLTREEAAFLAAIDPRLRAQALDEYRLKKVLEE